MIDPKGADSGCGECGKRTVHGRHCLAEGSQHVQSGAREVRRGETEGDPEGRVGNCRGVARGGGKGDRVRDRKAQKKGLGTGKVPNGVQKFQRLDGVKRQNDVGL